MPLISIITINYNNSAITEELLASLPAKNDFFQLEVIVVDNGSSPDPVPVWKEKYPHFTFIRSENNLGFSKGNNLGIKRSSGDFLFLVNNDTVFTEDLIPQMLRVFQENSRIGIASPKIYYFSEAKMIQYAGFTQMNMLTGRNHCIGQYEKDTGQQYQTGPTGYVHGAAMMVRREVLARAGMMPEDFFLYYEEMDWCEKIRAAGFEVWVIPSAVIYHKESVSVGKNSALKEYYMNRNRILFIRRNASAIQRMGFYLFYLLIVTPRNIFRYIRSGRFELIPVLFRAIGWNIANPGTTSEPLTSPKLN